MESFPEECYLGGTDPEGRSDNSVDIQDAIHLGSNRQEHFADKADNSEGMDLVDLVKLERVAGIHWAASLVSSSFVVCKIVLNLHLALGGRVDQTDRFVYTEVC